MSVRDLWVRVQVGSTLVAAAAPVRIQQQLEGAVTMVAEVAVAGLTPALATNADVAIQHVNRGALNAATVAYDARPLFAGVINRISAVGDPHGVTLSCTGELAKLRRTRTHEFEYALNGKTDSQVVQDVLTFCDVAYNPSDIRGWGYTLGRFQDRADTAPPIWWHAKQSGADIIGELDRVFGCATIELGDGRVVRFPYSRAPDRYLASVPYAKLFVRGQAGVSFYGNEHERGDLDRVQNFWLVRGLGFSGAEGTDDEGCQFFYQASAIADHSILGAGVAVGPQEFSSDLIDSEELAKAVAIRLMEWYNREPDTIRIQCGNDAKVGVGALIGVKDPSYGIDLGTMRPYLVTAVTRDGDTMLLDGVGGPTGVVGSVQSHLYRDCNDSTSDLGTDPPAFGAPDPVLPDVPPLETALPDLPPIEEPPQEPNTEELLIDCTETDGGLNSAVYGLSPPWRQEGTWFSEVTEDDAIPVGDPGHFQVDMLALAGTVGTLTYNTTPAGTPATSANDYAFGKNENITISGRVQINYPDVHFAVGFDPIAGHAPARTTWYGEPGFHTDPVAPLGPGAGHLGGDWGMVATSENNSYGYPGIPSDQLNGDNGALTGAPCPVGEAFEFSVAFDVASAYQSVAYAGPGGAAQMHDQEAARNPLDPNGALVIRTYDDCAHAVHHLSIEVTGPLALDPDPSWAEKPLIQFTALSLGIGTCTLNPDYLPPVREEF